MGRSSCPQRSISYSRDSALRQTLFRSQGHLGSLLPVSPPTEPHLSGACSSPAPHGLLSQPYGHSEIGSHRACRQTAPLFHPVGQAGILRIMSSVGLCCKGQEGPWCAISGELDPTAFPFQRAFSQAESCLRAEDRMEDIAVRRLPLLPGKE